MVRYFVGLYGMASLWCLGYGTSLVYMVWYIVDFMVRCIVGFRVRRNLFNSYDYYIFHD